MKEYRTDFSLTNPVNDLEDAREYLTSDDMTKYLRDSVEFYDAIEYIVWILDDEWEGHIKLITNRPLTPDELEVVSNWVSGQNSDGLGEGFEQQPFAELFDEVEYEDEDPDTGDAVYYTENEYVGCASFDWQSNDYHFEEV